MLRLGLIGYRNHAERLRAAAEAAPGDDGAALARVERVYHPRVLVPEIGTHELRDLLDCDAILIASPDATHFHYLSWLRDRGFDGYVLCEKSPVTTREDLASLRGFDGSRIYFNFNLRHSNLAAELRREIDGGALGRPLHFFASLGYGLAFKDSYRGSWRADASTNPLGILGVLGVHFLDLAIALLGAAPRFHVHLTSAAATGSAPDTVSVQLDHAGGATTHLFFSYATPCQQRIALTASDGIAELLGEELVVRGPRETFDAEGRFRAPDPLRSVTVGADPFDQSLGTSVATFLRHCRDKRPLDPRWFEDSLRTTDLLLRAGRGAG